MPRGPTEFGQAIARESLPGSSVVPLTTLPPSNGHQVFERKDLAFAFPLTSASTKKAETVEQVVSRPSARYEMSSAVGLPPC